jgi:hypothetical protein
MVTPWCLTQRVRHHHSYYFTLIAIAAPTYGITPPTICLINFNVVLAVRIMVFVAAVFVTVKREFPRARK